MNAADRRVHPRHAFDRAVFCYHDGTRVAGKPIDLSIGGMLFAAPEAAHVQKGTQMGVIFDRACGIDPPVYLFGRVVRFQKEPVEGIGLRWLKATTGMEAPALALFLEALFGISAATLLPSVAVGQGRMRSTFEFEPFLRAAVERQRATSLPKSQGIDGVGDLPPARTSLRDPEAGPIGLITRPEEVDALHVEVVHHDQGFSGARATTPTPEGAAARGEPAGAVDRRRPPTTELQAVERPVAADLPATLEVGGERVRVRITQFERSTLFARTLVGPLDLDGVYPLRFSIATREGEVVVTVTTRIAEVRTGRNESTPGLGLDIVDLDEGAHPGLVARYLKWLQQSGPHGRS